MPQTYVSLLAIRRVRLPLVASIVGRLPYGSLGLAVILLVQAQTGSFADAGLVEAAFTVGLAIGLPAQGRLVDRIGQTRILVPGAVANAVAIVAFVLAARADASVAALGAINLVAGLTLPPLSQCMRGLWGWIVDEPHALQSAYALDAVIIEVAFIVGPLLTAVLAAWVSPAAAVLVSGALSTTGALGFAWSSASREWRGIEIARDWAGALRSPGIRALGAAALGIGFAMGALVLALTAFGARHGSPEAAGPLISIQAIASMTGGLWYGTRRWDAPPEERYARLNLLLAAGLAPLALAPSVGVMAALVALGGFALAPSTAVLYVLVDRASPRGMATEAFGWVTTATVLGSGVGEALAGAIVNGGHLTAGFLLALAGALGSFLVALAARPVLRPRPQAA